VPERQIMELPRHSLAAFNNTPIKNLPMIINVIYKPREVNMQEGHKSEGILTTPKYSLYRYPTKNNMPSTSLRENPSNGSASIPRQVHKRLERRCTRKSIPKVKPVNETCSFLSLKQKYNKNSKMKSGNNPILIPNEVFITNSEFISNFLYQHKKKLEATLKAKYKKVQSRKVSPTNINSARCEFAYPKHQFRSSNSKKMFSKLSGNESKFRFSENRKRNVDINIPKSVNSTFRAKGV